MALQGNVNEVQTIIGSVAAVPAGSSSGGTTDHSKLSNRDAAEQHPIEAITGLRKILDEVKAGSVGNANCPITVETIIIEENPGGETENVPVTGLSLDLNSYSAKVGDGFYINPVVFPTNATNRAVSWKSSNTAAATVSSVGYVECIASGDTVITCTTEDGGYTAACAVSVAAAESAGGKVQFSTLEITDGFFKADGAVVSLGKTYHTSIPYTEGMQISTGTNGSWNISTYPPIVVFDGGEYSAPTVTKADTTVTVETSTVTPYTATLTGYGTDAAVYVSMLVGRNAPSTEEGKADMDEADIYWYIPGGES